VYEGYARDARIATIATATISSIKVNPRCFTGGLDEVSYVFMSD
jgi:hypothetical protein